MSDKVKEGIPNIGFSPYSDDSIVIIDEKDLEKEEGEFSGKSRDELIAEVNRMKTEIQAAGEKGSERSTTLEKEVSDLRQNMQSAITVDQLKALAQLQGQVPQQKGETESEFRERIKTAMLDDPIQALDEYIGRKITPEVQRLSANNLFWSQKTLENDREKGEIYRKYKAQIDAEVQKANSQDKLYDPEVYHKAYQRVMINNIDVIVEERVRQAMEKQGGDGGTSTSQRVSFSETGVNSPSVNPGGQRKQIKVVLTPEEKQRAFAIGMTEKDYASRKARKEGLV